MKRRIYAWFTLNTKKRKFVYNHYEEGWSGRMEPTPRTKQQKKAWKGLIWMRKHALLVDRGQDGNHDYLVVDGTEKAEDYAKFVACSSTGRAADS